LAVRGPWFLRFWFLVELNKTLVATPKTKNQKPEIS